MKKIRIYLSLLTLSVCSITQAQIEKHTYKQQLQGVQNEWHTLDIPSHILSKTQEDLSDLRIIGVTDENDTVSVPYFIDMLSPSTSIVETPLQIINKVNKNGTYYITLKPLSKRSINRIKLDFDGTNFDYRLKLQGSNDKSEWFTILEKYRVLSIQTGNQNYTYTDLIFSDTQYKYYRISIPKKANKPSISAAKMMQLEKTQENVNEYKLLYAQSIDAKNTTTLMINLSEHLPLSTLELNTSYKTDFIREIRILAVTDSFQTEKGWKESYTDLYSGSFTSFENHVYNLRDIHANKLKVMIYHKENTPFDIDVVKLKGYKRRLTARFDQPAKYALYYGNPASSKPRYDIELFKDKIPKNLTPLALGDPIRLNKYEEPKNEIESKTWLWVVMGITIFTLGLFTLKMMRKVE